MDEKVELPDSGMGAKVARGAPAASYGNIVKRITMAILSRCRPVELSAAVLIQ